MFKWINIRKLKARNCRCSFSSGRSEALLERIPTPAPPIEAPRAVVTILAVNSLLSMQLAFWLNLIQRRSYFVLEPIPHVRVDEPDEV
jgi:hypothetical protein